MLDYMSEYELVKAKKHEVYTKAIEFYVAKRICKQNFLKYYRRYKNSGEDINSLLPHKTGRKFKDILEYNSEIIDKICILRQKAYNKYDISDILKKRDAIDVPASSVYRFLKKLGLNRLNMPIKQEKQRIIKEYAGQMGHIDVHYLPKGLVLETGNKKLYLVGIIDDYSRICWVEVIDSIKSLDVMFAAMSLLTYFKGRYGVSFQEMLSDNGSEFASRNNIENHPFEKMLSFYEIKHRYTKPCTPQTNGKIERFWKTIEEELLSGEKFDTIEELKHHITGYMIYYNEHRKHQGIGNQIPLDFLQQKR
jgi:IS30 family transposase